MTELERRINTYLEAFETFAEQATPQAIDLALAIVRWESLGILIVAWVALLGGTGVAYWLFRRSQKLDPLDDGFPFHVIGGVFSALGAIISLIYAANPWLYIGVVRPELKLARDAFARLVGS